MIASRHRNEASVFARVDATCFDVICFTPAIAVRGNRPFGGTRGHQGIVGVGLEEEKATADAATFHHYRR